MYSNCVLNMWRLQVVERMYSNQELAGIRGDNLFGPQVLPKYPTGRNYKAFLENNMPDFLADVPLIIRRELHFMQDGAPAHFSLVDRRYPNRKFSGR
jgi:hypothetical protein